MDETLCWKLKDCVTFVWPGNEHRTWDKLKLHF